MMRKVLVEHTSFNKGWVYSKKFAVGFGDGLVTMQSGNHHKADRSLIQRYFLKGHLDVRKKIPSFSCFFSHFFGISFFPSFKNVRPNFRK